MTKDLSKSAHKLLVTIMRESESPLRGKFFKEKYIKYWYRLDDEINEDIKKSLAELIEKKYIIRRQKDHQTYITLPPADDYISADNQDRVHIEHINSSNISLMSNNVNQFIDANTLDDHTKEILESLHNSIKTKDNSRVKNILDAMIAESPSVLLQLLQIGLGGIK